ncbi:helicase-related protein [Nostoc sp.]|uniref:helicase-related protein n=1 Tax=Nostoc sp. TaxID=1180 RepID=UPI002FFAEDAC
MESSLLQQASIWGQVFEIAIKRGVLQQLIHRNLLLNDHPVFQLWQSHKNADISHQLVKAFKITDPNHKEWVETMLRHLLVLGYGLGWTAMRECLNHSQIRQPKLEAIWCPLTLPGQQMQRDEEKEETAKAFQETFNIPGKPDENLVKRGQPARADFILCLSNELSPDRNTEEIILSEDFKSAFSQPKDIKRKKIENLIICLEFSYNAPIKFADFQKEAPHREEMSRYARYIESRGVFSRVCAEVEGEDFSLSKRLENFLSAFSGQDKPLFKLCQASSYTDRLIHVLRVHKRLEGSCNARAIAVTSNGMESLAAQFWGVEPEPDTRAKLMQSLGKAYCQAKHSDDDVPLDLDAEIRLVFTKLVRSLPSAFKEQAQHLAENPTLGQYSHFLFQENVTDFYNPMGEISKAEAIASIEDNDALLEFFGGNPVTPIADCINEINPDKATIPLRQVHQAAVFAGITSAQVGKINVLALEGNPGIGKTTAVTSKLTIDYSIRLSPIKPGQNSDGTEQTIRQAIREKSEEESLTNAYLEIKGGLQQGAEQLIFFAQDKAFLRQLREKLTTGKEALVNREQVEVLDQSVSPDRRLKLVKPPRRDEVRVFLMTSSGARGVSFPKTDCIIAAIPRFNIEAALMEVAQLIYRGRGMYADPETGMEVSGDGKDRRLVMLINDFIIEREDIDPKRLWLRQSSDLLTLLVMLRSTIHTRIKGDAGLNKNRIAFVPVGSVGDEELLRLMSDDVLDFLREAKIFINDSHPQEAKAIVKRAELLTGNIFKHFDLRGQSLERNAKSYANYQTLQALTKTVSRISSRLLPSLDNDELKIPDNLTCIGPFWIEDWSDRQTEEIFSFEAWKADVKQNSSRLLGSLKEIAESQKFKFPSKLKRPANELYKLLSREQEGFVIESSTRQALKTKNIVIGLPLDYPHFWNEQSEDDTPQQILQDPQAWRSALGRSLTPQGLIIPVVPHYRTFPWVAVAGRRIFTQLETVFSDRYFMASSELNLLNTILLEDEADKNSYLNKKIG